MISAIGRYFVGEPNIVAIVTDDDLTDLTTVGYWVLPETVDSVAALQNGEFQWTDTDLVLIHYDVSSVGFFTYNAANQCFVALAPNGGIADTLPSAQILVGNNSNVATAVAMSGDVAIDNAGATTIQPDAVTTAKILNANVTLAKLATAIAPAGVIKFMGQHTTVGGAAAEAITVTGAVAATDRAFVQLVDDGTNNVSVLSAVVTTNTLTVTFSADPGADAIINYQLIRATA